MAKRRGRPLGYRLSEESKRAISTSKEGQLHKQETKDKISKTLLLRFRQLDPLSDEIADIYCGMSDDELCSWVNDVRAELDSSEQILTERRMRTSRRIEISCGHDIERFSHGLPPEVLIMVKQMIEKLGKNAEKFLKDL